MRALKAIVFFCIFVIVVALVYMYSGSYDVAAVSGESPVISWIASTTADRSIDHRAEDLSLTLPTDSAALDRGGREYVEMCVGCHGAPGVKPDWSGQGLNPEPPDLQESAQELSPEEIYWVIRHGVKMTGMPGLQPTHRDEVIQAIAAFVVQLPQMSDAQFAAFQERVEAEEGEEHEHEGGAQATEREEQERGAPDSAEEEGSAGGSEAPGGE